MSRRLRILAFAAVLATPAAVVAQEFDCIIEARQTVDIRSPVDGLIESIGAERGQVVKKGQLLVQLESGPERAALAIAKSRAESTGPLRSAEAKLDLARSGDKMHALKQVGVPYKDDEIRNAEADGRAQGQEIAAKHNLRPRSEKASSSKVASSA